jgi:hypothetical protein
VSGSSNQKIKRPSQEITGLGCAGHQMNGEDLNRDTAAKNSLL